MISAATKAVVDLDRVVAMSKLGQDLQGRVQKFQQDAVAEAEVIRKAAAAIQQRAADGGNSLTADQLAELQQQFEDKQIELRRLQETKQRQGQKLKTEGLKAIEVKLEPVFKQIRDEGNYDLIINNVPGVVLMVNDKVDLTAKVLDLLNAGG